MNGKQSEKYAKGPARFATLPAVIVKITLGPGFVRFGVMRPVPEHIAQAFGGSGGPMAKS